MRLIDADAIEYTYTTVRGTEDGHNWRVFAVGEDEIDAMPTIDAEPVIHGEWIPKNKDGSWRVDTCSVCKKDTHYVRYAPPYERFPHCGAKMDKT